MPVRAFSNWGGGGRGGKDDISKNSSEIDNSPPAVAWQFSPANLGTAGKQSRSSIFYTVISTHPLGVPHSIYRCNPYLIGLQQLDFDLAFFVSSRTYFTSTVPFRIRICYTTCSEKTGSASYLKPWASKTRKFISHFISSFDGQGRSFRVW